VPENFQSLVNVTKVNNINAAARYEVPGYTGPFLPSGVTACDTKVMMIQFNSIQFSKTLLILKETLLALVRDLFTFSS
jgi:hypothetical protein